MRKIKYKKGRKVQPSILEYTGVHNTIGTQMQLFVYDDNDLTEYPDFKINKFPETLDLTKINWLNIHGLNDIELIKSIGAYLDVDNFILGDILNTTRRTKLDELHDLISQIDTKEEIVFRANHGSNAYTIKGTFPQDKQEMLEKIEWMKQHPEIMRPQGLRGF